MKKSDYMKYAWNRANDIELKCPEENYITQTSQSPNGIPYTAKFEYTKFKYAIGVKIGLNIAIKIMENGWTEEEINSYLYGIFGI